MNRPFELVAPDRLQVREGGGCLALFGFPFFAAGVFLILTSLRIVPVSASSDMPPPGWGLLFLMGLPFTAVGATLTFGRAWTTIDRTERTVVKQYGLLIPLYEKAVPVQECTAVTLGFVAGDSDSADSFPVGLKCRGAADLALCRFTAYARARECAGAIAEHLGIDVEDVTTDHPVRVRASQIDEPVKMRVLREGSLENEVMRPSNARSEVTRDMDGTRLVIPLRRLPALVLLAAFAPAAIPLAIGFPLASFFERSRTPGAIGLVFIGFLTLFFGILPAMAVVNGFLRSRRGATIVEVTREGLRIQERGAWTTRTVASLDAADILDVDYSSKDSTLDSARRAAEQQVLRSHPSAPPELSPRVERILAVLSRFARGKGVIVKTRAGLTTFGQGLDDEEIRYLHSVVRRALLE